MVRLFHDRMDDLHLRVWQQNINLLVRFDEVKMSVRDSIPSAISAYELPTIPVKILIAARKKLAIIPISVVFRPRLTAFLSLRGLAINST